MFFIRNKDISSLIDGPKVVLIHCHTKWSDPCKSLMTILEEISEKYEDNNNVHILALDIEENPETVESYNIKAVPELLYFANGELIDKSLGIPDKSVISSKINSLLARLSRR